MENTQKFNLGKFNIKNNGKLNGNATSIVTSQSAAKANVIFAASAAGEAVSGTIVQQPDTISQYQANSDTISDSAVHNFYKIVALFPEESNAISESNAKTAEIFGIEIISLPNLVLKPGQEFIIDTDNMTATIDGQNAIYLLSDDSAFFFLAQGENLITYMDGSGNRQANLKVMWKDRWL